MKTVDADPVTAMLVEAHHALTYNGFETVVLAPEARSLIEAVMADLLLSRPARDRYIGRWREHVRRSALPADIEEAVEAIDLPADRLTHEGVGSLTDRELAAIAVQPHALIVLAEVIAEAVVTDALGSAWQSPFDRVVRDAYPEPVEAMADRLTVRLSARQPETRRLGSLAAFVRVAVDEGGVRNRPWTVAVTVENSSDRTVFVTLVGLGEFDFPFHYTDRGDFIRVPPDQTRRIELPTLFDTIASGLVICTTTPAGEVATHVIDNPDFPSAPDEALRRAAPALRDFGYDDFAIEVVTFRGSGN